MDTYNYIYPMSIKVEQLTKKYEEQIAVNKISFEIQKGEIVGFLGPNGAGKSTTMKMITGFIEPSQGNTYVNDVHVQSHPLEARKKIGYLPEHNPLYLEMYVEEFLAFVGEINQVQGNLKERINEMIQLTGLERERKKKIEQLSKGYRQRVGLAAALIHNPEVIILDEPTTGLDPNQILEIRHLIKEISKDKTIMLSSHIMQEVQALCDRIIIINKGNMIADKSIEAIQAMGKSNFTIHLEIIEQLDIEQMKSSIDSIVTIDKESGEYKIQAKEDIRQEIFKYCVQNNLTLTTIFMEKRSLEDVFQSLTK